MLLRAAHVAGKELGTLIWQAEAMALAVYVFQKDGLLDSMSCSHAQLEVSIAINANDLVQRDVHLSLLRSVACFYQLSPEQASAKLAPPGDYLDDLFDNNVMRQLCCAGIRVAAVRFGSIRSKTVPVHAGSGSHQFPTNYQQLINLNTNQKRLPRTHRPGGYFLNTETPPQNPKNENRPKLARRSLFQSSR